MKLHEFSDALSTGDVQPIRGEGCAGCRCPKARHVDPACLIEFLDLTEATRLGIS